MRKRTIYRLALGITLLVVLTGGFFLFRFFYPAAKSDLKLLLPEKTSLVIELNSHQVLKTVMRDVLQNETSLGISLSQLKEKWESQEVEYPGVDFNKEIVFFAGKWEDISVYGLLVHISKLKDFENLKVRGSTLKQANKKHGIILYTEKELTQEEKKSLSQKAEEIIGQNVPKRKASKEIIHFNFQEEEQKLDFQVYLEKETLRIAGKNLRSKGNYSTSDSMTLLSAKEKEYLEIRTGQLPKTLNYFLEDYLKGMNIYLPQIKAQRLLIYNSNIQTIYKKLTVLPTLDWLIKFTDEVDIKRELNKSKLPNYLVFDSTTMLVNAKELNYYIKQPSPKELYISNAPQFNELKEAIQPTFSISGQPAVLMSLDGSGFVANMIQALPPVRSAQEFLKMIEVFHFETKNSTNGEQQIEGELKLSDQRLISIELLKLMLK